MSDGSGGVGDGQGSNFDDERPGDFDTRAAAAAYYVVWRKRDGNLVAKSSGKQVTPEALELLQRVAFAEAMVANGAVVRDDGDRLVYRNQLLSYAQTGLEGGSVTAALAALSWFEDRVTDEQGPSIRRRHIATTLRTAGVVGVPAAALGLLLPHVVPAGAGLTYGTELALLKAALWLLVGNSLGVTFFTFVRNLDLRFDQLGKLDPAKLDPGFRFVLVVVTTTIFAILLAVGIVQFGLGGKLLNDFFHRDTLTLDPLLCVVTGILAGYADSTAVANLTGVLRADGSPPKRA